MLYIHVVSFAGHGLMIPRKTRMRNPAVDCCVREPCGPLQVSHGCLQCYSYGQKNPRKHARTHARTHGFSLRMP